MLCSRASVDLPTLGNPLAGCKDIYSLVPPHIGFIPMYTTTSRGFTLPDSHFWTSHTKITNQMGYTASDHGSSCLFFFSSPVTPCNQSVFDILSLLPPTLSSLCCLLFLLSSFISPYSQSLVQTPSFTVPPSHSKRGSCPAKEKKYESSPSTVTVYFEQPRDGAVNVNYSFPFGRKPSQENDM